MSHFVVLVTGHNIDEQMAPFQENNMGDCPKEYLEFNDTESEYFEQYCNDTQRRLRLADGSVVSPYEERFRNPEPLGHPQWLVPKGAVEISVLHKETYITFEQFMKEYCGYEKRDEETGRYGYWENPNKKWDWFQIGGRWTGYFKGKPGTEGGIGEPGLMTSEANEGHFDSMVKRDIDVQGMKEEAAKEASEYRNKVLAAVAGLPAIESWDQIKARLNLTDVDATRAAYNAQPGIKAIREAGLHRFYEDPVNVIDEKYVQRQADKSLTPFALLHEGEWYARGDMGWWACVSNEKGQEEWSDKFWQIFDSLSDDTRITAVDCHI